LKEPALKEQHVSFSMKQRYTAVAIGLHWVIAALIVANILLAWSVDLLPKVWERPIIDLHKSFGTTVLGLAIMRILWRFNHKPPALPPYAPWEKFAAHAVHWSLYGLIFLMPVSGWLHDSAWKGGPTHPMKLYWILPWFRIGAVQNLDPVTKEYLHGLFGLIHTSLAYVIYAMVAAHIAGALKHQFLDGEPEFQRMGVALSVRRRVKTQ
jgi:cytochrome b561